MAKYTDTDLHLAGVDCDRKRLAMHQAEVAMQEDCNVDTDSAYYGAVEAMVASENHYYAVEAALGYARS